MIEFEKTIISQYANSTILTQLIENLNTYVSPDANLQAFYTLIGNLDTAVGYGLDVWGRRLGVGRTVTTPSTRYFGFSESGNTSADPFDQSPFFSGTWLTTNYVLDDEPYRLLLFAKAAANITNCSIPALNQLLINLFPNRGNCYVRDDHPLPNGDFFTFEEQGDHAWGFDQQPFGDLEFDPAQHMRFTYVFDFALTQTEIAVVVYSGVLPKPTGVSVEVEYQA